jgi:macrolide-specific efflux system membrane fusion protein
MINRPGLATVVILLAGLAGAAAYWFWPKPDTPLFETVAARIGDIEDLVTASGTLQPRDYVDVGAQVSGQIQKLHVDIGSEVKAGQLLAELDPRVYLSRVDADRAQLATQRAQLKDQEAQLTLAQQLFNRQQNLQSEGATSAEAVESAEAALASAAAQIEALKAEIRQTESSLRGDQANLDYTKIYAPMSGTVVSLDAKQGQTLNANQSTPTILRIADLRTMTVQAQVSEADIAKLRPGMEVYFTTLGNREQRWYSRLRQILPTPEVTNNVVLYKALFDIPNPDGALLTQMTTQVFFVVAAAQNALLVPITALNSANGKRELPARAMPSADRPRPARAMPVASHPPAPSGNGNARSVRVLDAAGGIEERAVSIGVTNRVSAQILSGLQAGEVVITGNRVNEAARAGGNERFGPPPRL